MIKPTILIVEDTPDNIDILCEALQNDYDLRIATDGQKALDVIEKSGLPELILMDVMMPVMDGYEACRRLKADPLREHIPVIFLTAKSEEEDILKGFELGAADYVQKPIRIPELKARIKTHLEIQENRAKLDARNQELSEILHILSHDLANPFNSIRSVLSILEDDIDGIRETLPDLDRSAKQGQEIIELIKQLRSLEEKGLDISKVDLSDAWNDSVTSLIYRFEEKGVDLSPLAFDEPQLVMAERVSLVNSILNNLLTNALKFTPEGKSVTAELNSEHGQIVLTIRDEGMGIPQDILENLFDPTARNTQRIGTGGEKGTGFGMPIVKRMMEHYGGSIEVESEVGKGTEFSLYFLK